MGLYIYFCLSRTRSDRLDSNPLLRTWIRGSSYSFILLCFVRRKRVKGPSYEACVVVLRLRKVEGGREWQCCSLLGSFSFCLCSFCSGEGVAESVVVFLVFFMLVLPHSGERRLRNECCSCFHFFLVHLVCVLSERTEGSVEV